MPVRGETCVFPPTSPDPTPFFPGDDDDEDDANGDDATGVKELMGWGLEGLDGLESTAVDDATTASPLAPAPALALALAPGLAPAIVSRLEAETGAGSGSSLKVNSKINTRHNRHTADALRNCCCCCCCCC